MLSIGTFFKINSQIEQIKTINPVIAITIKLYLFSWKYPLYNAKYFSEILMVKKSIIPANPNKYQDEFQIKNLPLIKKTMISMIKTSIN